MIRKIFSVLFGLLILAVAARAETGEEIALAAYPGYVVVSSDSGNGFGVFALENGNETALCIVEDGRLTIANERAFEAGKNVKVYVDTDGESLFVGYNTEYEYVTLHAEYRAEGWTRCDVLNQKSYGNGRTLETMLFERNDMLTMTVGYCDENDNPIGESETVRIPVGEDFDLSLGGIDMLKLPLTPEMCDREESDLPDGFAEPLLADGETLMQMGAYPERLILLVGKADGSRCVRVCDWAEGVGYSERDSVPLSGSAGLDIIHADADKIFVDENGREYFFRKTRQGRWLLAGSMGGGVLNVGVDCVCVSDEGGTGKNDGYIYGKSEPLDLMKVPVGQWPTRQEEAVARLDTDAYAFVNNDNPKDRLHLREKPDRKAKSLGKFYNRTPVQILSWDGDWAHVRIGAGDANLEGYMMTRYLVRGGGNRDVSCAFETLMAVDALEDGAPIYRVPDDTVEMFGRFLGDYVIGVYGDDWVIAMTWDGDVGYVRRADLWAGNG